MLILTLKLIDNNNRLLWLLWLSWLRNWSVLSNNNINRLLRLLGLLRLSVVLSWLRSVSDHDVDSAGDLNRLGWLSWLHNSAVVNDVDRLVWLVGLGRLSWLSVLYDSAVVNDVDWLGWLSVLVWLGWLHDSAVVHDVDRLVWLGWLGGLDDRWVLGDNGVDALGSGEDHTGQKSSNTERSHREKKLCVCASVLKSY